MATSEIYDVRGAAAYLGLKPETIKYHLYVSRRLVPSARFAKAIVFTRSDLDKFRALNRPAHRPRSSSRKPAVPRPRRRLAVAR